MGVLLPPIAALEALDPNCRVEVVPTSIVGRQLLDLGPPSGGELGWNSYSRRSCIYIKAGRLLDLISRGRIRSAWRTQPRRATIRALLAQVKPYGRVFVNGWRQDVVYPRCLCGKCSYLPFARLCPSYR